MSTVGRAMLIGLALLAMGLAFSAPAHAQAREYALSVNDRVQVKVFGWPDLSGEFVVGPDGSISIPLAGDIPAAGAALDDLRTAISDRLTPFLPARPNVTLEMTSYGPIYVTGSVDSPGAYDFTPGMTALIAVARAGGAPLLMRLDADSALDVLKARETLETLKLEVERLNAETARLRAERDGADLTADDSDTSSGRFADLIARERELMLMRRETEREALAQMRQQQQQFRDEAASLDRQLAAKEREIELLNDLLAGQRALLEKGLVRESGLVEYQRQIVAAEGDRNGIAAFRARALQNVTRIEREITERKAERRAEIATDLQSAEAEIATFRVRMASSRSILAALGATSDANPAENRSYRIHRQENGETRVFVAVGSAPIRPGDLIEVLSTPPDD